MNGLCMAVIGAGSTYTPELIEGLICRRERLPLRELRLMDIDARKNEIVGNFAERMLRAAGIAAKVVRTEDLRAALEGVDFAVAQVRVGGLVARRLDERIPLKYGLLGQETTGIGGMMKALRTIPVVRNIARTMEAVAPGATLINFSNPSGLVAQALLGEAPERRLIGLCNVPINMQAQAAQLLSVSPEALEYGFVGLNHLLYLNSVRQDGRERIGELLQRPLEQMQKNIPDVPADMDFLRQIEALPCGYLNYFYARRAMLEKCRKAEQCRAEQCMEIERELLALYRQPELCRKPEILSKRGGALYSEAAISLMEAIWCDTGAEHVVNVRNDGAYPFMAADDVVEVQCRVNRAGCRPLPLRKQPHRHIIGLMQAVKAYERLAAQAAMEGDMGAALEALAVHPLIGDIQAGKACLQEMLQANRAYLPQFFEKEKTV